MLSNPFIMFEKKTIDNEFNLIVQKKKKTIDFFMKRFFQVFWSVRTGPFG